MSAITIFHNNRCSKSRCAMSILEEKGIEPEVRYYLDNAPSIEELRDLLKKLGMKAEALVRKNETIFKENFKGKTFSEDEWIEILSENPKLIQRPIIIKGDKAVVGRPPENIEQLF